MQKAIDSFEALLFKELLRPLESSLSGEKSTGGLGAHSDLLSSLWLDPVAHQMAERMDLFPSGLWVSDNENAMPPSASGFAIERRPQLDLVQKDSREAPPEISRKKTIEEALHPSQKPTASPADHTAVRNTAALESIRSEKTALKPIDSLIQKVSGELDLPANLIRAIVMRESTGRSDAVSSKGAQGLMQLMPGTAKDMGVLDPLNPLDNLRGGARYIKNLLQRFQKPQLALAAYHAGPRRVEEYDGVPPYPSTKAYIKDVLELKSRFDAADPEGATTSSFPGSLGNSI
ncbi:MAG: lytic transglycosylase domain-containing protein [Candidatus Eisenbacteria bacterium]|uniref:Lytic transglycosylase domain-containing protein n=1 Tax=Eiseniibacteriota bacterium TaxID=2212470 RepID=A0A948S0C5_UNCEI|nr:lytic transglycosylase domain-containing protein [Candidatus Eisenbacteria bacterium]